MISEVNGISNSSEFSNQRQRFNYKAEYVLDLEQERALDFERIIKSEIKKVKDLMSQEFYIPNNLWLADSESIKLSY